MTNPVQLTQKVHAHLEKRAQRLMSFAGIMLLVLFSTVGYSQYRLISHLTRLQLQNEELTTRHKEQAALWHRQAQSAKRLKALKQEPSLFCPAQLLSVVAQSIGPHTLLTTLTYKERILTLQGYSASAEELTEFLTQLTRQGATDVTLCNTTPGPGGLSFTIKSCYS